MSISISTAARADPALIKNFRVVIYNGDWDSCVPYTDAEAWTEGMGYDVKDPWHAWMYNLTFEGETTSQVGGYATRCEMARFPFPRFARRLLKGSSPRFFCRRCADQFHVHHRARRVSRDYLWHLGCIFPRVPANRANKRASSNRADRRHEVPETAPDKAYAMLRGVLEGRLF